MKSRITPGVLSLADSLVFDPMHHLRHQRLIPRTAPAEAVEPAGGERKCVTGPAFPDAK